ncbi:POTRA domain-containing protein, partial [Janthinobacterium sp. FT14W]|uniref:POTRA domain-containing protein n=1 Tax=Janthinobacterium sp. FT14W TaxID=2654253 RepID=UPI0029CA96BF
MPPGSSQRDDASQELIRQQERERLLRQQQERTPDVRLLEAPAAAAANRLPAGESPCFTIDHLELRGEDAELFQWALAAASRDDLGAPDAALGRCLGTQAINVLMGRMQNAIIARGYVTTRVLAEPQD